MSDFERLGVFYLGKAYDPAKRSLAEDLVLYDSRHLTTHAVCVGMTGSGKTGLCVGLLEEAAIDGVPAIAIDPKGDISNLLLTFPGLSAAEFRPWIDETEAGRQGLSPDAFAERTATGHAEGLRAWGQDAARIQRFRDACELSIYTPGSSAGLELSLLRSFAPPEAAVLEDAELLAGAIEGTVSGLLGLLGIEADPMRSREHVLLSQILGTTWAAGNTLDLAGLIQAVQVPSFSRIGVIELEAFYPKQDRADLAIALNSLLASPAASAWTRGEPLDIKRLLYTPEGKPKISILSISHLSEAQRMFFVTTLLDAMIAWMRQQQGTSSLRALLYMDEIFGYFPPTAMPPSKRPMLLLLKQARAFGLGIVLATQNPVDLDYKGLSNCGTWFLGRLQTERDKLRVLDGLESAATGAQSFDRSAMDTLLSTLGSRVFVLNDVREAGPVVFQTRQTLSFLRGPLAREQIKLLMADKRPAAGASVAVAGSGSPQVSAAQSPSAAGSGASIVRPSLPDGVSEAFLPALPGPGPLLYQPALWAAAKLHFVNAKAGVDTWKSLALLAPLSASDVDVQWERATPAAEGFTASAQGAPEPSAAFLPLPKQAANVKKLAEWKKAFALHLYQHQALTLSECKALKLSSNPGEDPAAFRARLAQGARESRDALLAKVKQKYDPKFERLKAQWAALEAKIDKERAEATASQVDSIAAVGSTVLGALFGRSALSATTVRRGASAVKSAGRMSKQRGDVVRAEDQLAALREQWAELQAEANESLQAVQNEGSPEQLEITETQIAARKADINVTSWMLVWLPYRELPNQPPAPAFSWP